MNINDIVVSLIKSDDIKQQLKESKHCFNINEQISLIYNSDLELDEKYNLIKYIAINCELTEEVKIELSTMLNNINNFNLVLENKEFIFVFYNEYNDVKIAQSFKDLQRYILNKKSKVNLNNINVIDLNNSDLDNNTVYNIRLNDKANIISFESLGEYTITKLEKAYIYIPNNIEIGDTITVKGDDTEYIVINDSSIPENLRDNCSFADSSITVIKKEVLSGNKDYKHHIEDIFKQRINSLNNEEVSSDMLKENSLIISLLNVNRIYK